MLLRPTLRRAALLQRRKLATSTTLATSDTTAESKFGGSGYADLSELERFERRKIPCVLATEESLKGTRYYGEIVTSEGELEKHMRNQRWPKPDGWRTLSPGTGDEQLPRIGTFSHYWNGEIAHADNEAVEREYRIGVGVAGEYVLAREMNYHPCGAQVVFPRTNAPFVALLGAVAKDHHPDDLVIEDIRAFYFQGDKGLCIPAGVWHQPVYAVKEPVQCIDIQSSVHACVVMDTIKELSLTMEIPLKVDSESC